ncbi:hypothetical protein PSACC_00242 [Paramicrosporidium saccamoebae]|uniref:Peptidase S9 prolyl oligopeptidase catalytic domain-containing protein n=1 Tax=Paramicrosporidium saccamoebae TaxID=1246581 RepID=A0A2H9TQB3_9FUNG|nr:hypothetical protein PSACC_00242 [Paramicrosporidium saccamoebae]
MELSQWKNVHVVVDQSCHALEVWGVAGVFAPKSSERCMSAQCTPSSRKWCTIKWILLVVAIIVALLVTFLVGLWIYHPKFVYDPTTFPGVPESKLLSDHGPTPITILSSDGTKLRAYWLRHPDADKSKTPLTTLLFMHGNTGNLEASFKSIAGWQRHLPLNALVLSYRGFGYSEGTPLMAGIRMDSQAALEYLQSERSVDPKRIILYGHSLGGAVALHLTAANPRSFQAVVVENTFLSIRKMASHDVPAIAWASFVVTEKWDNEEQLRILAASDSAPHMLFISGAKDNRVPPEHMNQLWANAQAIKKGKKNMVLERLHMPECNHSCYELEGYYEGIVNFLSKTTTSNKAAPLNKALGAK